MILPYQSSEVKDRPVDELLYPPKVAHLFPSWFRSALLKVFGYTPEPFSRSFGWVKRRWDSEAAKKDPVGSYAYDYVAFTPGGPPVLREMVITNRMAAMANIPGKYPYPVYEIRSTGAYIAGPAGPAGAMTGARLSLHSQAFAIRNDIAKQCDKSLNLVEVKLIGAFKYVYPLDEQRRVWSLQLEGHQFNVGRLISSMYYNGVDAPGHWEWKDRGDGFGQPVWNSDISVEEDADDIPVLPVPARLLDNETLVKPSPFSLGMIKRRDPDRPDPTDPIGSVYRLLAKIARAFGIDF